jgi:allophanate hydrolase
MHRALGAGMGKDKTATLPEESKITVTDDGLIEIMVVGAHLTGMPLNHELTGSGGKLEKKCRTAAEYRLFVLPNTAPPKPGLIREPGFAGDGLEVEIWKVTPAAFGRFVHNIPAPLGIGKVTLDDGKVVSGFLCEAYAVEGAQEITHLGGWRTYIKSR